MKLNLNACLRTFIDKERGLMCRAVYIIKCVSYIRDNNINIHDYYEGDYSNERIKESNTERTSIN